VETLKSHADLFTDMSSVQVNPVILYARAFFVQSAQWGGCICVAVHISLPKLLDEFQSNLCCRVHIKNCQVNLILVHTS